MPGRRASVTRIHCTVSEVLRYDRCPWLSYYTDVMDHKQTTIDLGDEEWSRRVLVPRERGTAIHDFLASVDPAATHEECYALMRRIVVERLGHFRHADRAHALAAWLPEATAMLQHPTLRALDAAQQAGRRVERELPFMTRLAPGIDLSGTIDLLIEQQDGRWVLYDYKTTPMPQWADDVEWRLDQVERHRFQMILYAAAVEQVHGAGSVSRIDLVFTSPGMVATIEPTPAEIRRATTRAVQAMQGRRALSFTGPRTRGAFDTHRCTGCPALRVCRPSEVPAELLGGAANPT